LNILSDVITYVRRLIKTPSNGVISDALIVDYINRFLMLDVDARIQLFDLKKKYSFMTTPGVDRYNMPLYDSQGSAEAGSVVGANTIGMYPVYQGFTSPAFINGYQVPLETQESVFFRSFPNLVQNFQTVATGDGGTNYNLTVPISPNASIPLNPPYNGLIRGHVDTAGIVATTNNIDPPVGTTIDTNIPTTSIDSGVFITAISATGESMVVQDSGQFLTGNLNYGLLMNPGNAPYGNTAFATYSTTENTINYLTGEINVTFPSAVPDGANIGVQVRYFQSGIPLTILFYNNTLTLRPSPAMQYLVELEAYLSPAAFLRTTDALPYGYMSEYIARGAARKILSDTGDIEQFQFYEPLFREQEILVWKRSQRQNTNNRTQTLYSMGKGGRGLSNNMGVQN
jgi:hypothetical protein